MNRRCFIETSGILGMASLFPLYACTPSPSFKLGYQLYSVNDDMTNNPIATLSALKAMGYQDFETFGFDGEKGTYYGYPASAFKNILDDLELTASSGHYGFSDYFNRPEEEMKRFVDACIQGAKTLNKKYITWPWIAPELRTIENFKILAQKLNTIGGQVNAAGLGFAYHNHGYEFADQGGETCYDIILKETDPMLVKLQMDMYWVMHSSKLNPETLIKMQPGRYVMWHIKDMDKVTRDYTELGNGSIDYKKILPDPASSGLEFYYLEQGGNFAHNAMKSAADSAAYFIENLQQFL